MISLVPEGLRSILCLGAHSDDIEIGCGATILRLLEENPDIHIHWVVLSASGVRRNEAQSSARQFLSASRDPRIDVHDFEDSRFPYTQAAGLKDCFSEIASSSNPDLVLTHRQHDAHQDHRMVSDLTWQHFRDHLILEYEIPKYEGDLGNPNLFVPVSSKIAKRKIEILTSEFPSQSGKYWFEGKTFESLMTLRGLECRAEEGFAEGFYSRKAVFLG